MKMRESVGLYFGPPVAPLFGWLHRSSDPPQHAIVLCSAFGREELSSHASLRKLANRLAGAGSTVLRFDYLGTGDSAGGELSGNQLVTWKDSVIFAVEELKRLTGLERVVLIGLRLGAMLAWLAALERVDVTAVGLILPVLHGRNHVRELRVLHGSTQSQSCNSASGLESGGFMLSSATIAALGEVDLRIPARAAADRVLVVDRDDMPTMTRGWRECLHRPGVEIEIHELFGATELLLDPHHSIEPEGMWEAVVTWVARLEPQHMSGDTDSDFNDAARISEVLEQAIDLPVLGTTLAAVVSRPDSQAATGTVVLLLNAGATRRIGPSRVYVDVARASAALGHVAVRVDLSGLGDSDEIAGAKANVVYSPTAVDEVLEIVRQVSAWPGVARCVVVGLCSGAYHGFKAAVRGADVARVVAINPLTFFWSDDLADDQLLRPHQVRADITRYRSSMISMESWRKLVRGNVDMGRLLRVLMTATRRTATRSVHGIARSLRIPLREDLARELSEVTGRGVPITFVFASNEPGLGLLLEQGGTAVSRLQRKSMIEIQTIEGGDHVFTLRRPRQRLVDFLLLRLEVRH